MIHQKEGLDGWMGDTALHLCGRGVSWESLSCGTWCGIRSPHPNALLSIVVDWALNQMLISLLLGMLEGD